MNDYAELSSSRRKIAVFKPIGLEVYITPNGDIFDFEGREIINPTILFALEKVRGVSQQIQGLVFGVITSTSVNFVQNLKGAYFPGNPHTFSDIEFVMYDLIFPNFTSNSNYKLRIGQVETVLGKQPNCSVVEYELIGDFQEFNDLLVEKFNSYLIESIYIYDADRQYKQGTTYNKREANVYEIRPNQRFRTHIKHIIPRSILAGTGDHKQIIIADVLVAKYKKELVHIPIAIPSIMIRKGIWDKKKDLKNVPFWFSGFTVFTKKGVVIVCKKYDKFIL